MNVYNILEISYNLVSNSIITIKQLFKNTT